MVADTQQGIRISTLIEIQVNGTLIGVLDRDQEMVNIFCWKGWLIEIRCQAIDDQWTPFLIEYHTLTSEYTKTLVQQLTSDQHIRLAMVTKNHGLN